jgi:hypothetical protein
MMMVKVSLPGGGTLEVTRDETIGHPNVPTLVIEIRRSDEQHPRQFLMTTAEREAFAVAWAALTHAAGPLG